MANLGLVSLVNLESFIRLTKESKLSTPCYTGVHYTCIGNINATLQLAVHILRFLLSDLTGVSISNCFLLNPLLHRKLSTRKASTIHSAQLVKLFTSATPKLYFILSHA